MNECTAPVSAPAHHEYSDPGMAGGTRHHAPVVVQKSFTGVFATHQHDLLLPALRLYPVDGDAATSMLSRTVWWRVCTRRVCAADVVAAGVDASSPLVQYAEAVEDTAMVPTYEVANGKDTSSLAFQVAVEQVCHVWCCVASVSTNRTEHRDVCAWSRASVHLQAALCSMQMCNKLHWKARCDIGELAGPAS
jgi:hypothetical protein